LARPWPLPARWRFKSISSLVGKPLGDTLKNRKHVDHGLDLFPCDAVPTERQELKEHHSLLNEELVSVREPLLRTHGILLLDGLGDSLCGYHWHVLHRQSIDPSSAVNRPVQPARQRTHNTGKSRPNGQKVDVRAVHIAIPCAGGVCFHG